MSITYGGQELVQPSGQALDWAERMLDAGGAWDTPPHIPRGGAALQRLPYVPTAPTDEPGVNILCWPRGASRYAYGHFVVHETQLAIIRTAVSAGGTYNALQFIFSDGVQTVSPYLYMLPPKPVAAPDPSNSLPGLYLITLVDERYLWWCKGVAGTALDVTSWATLYASLGTALGVTITADAVHSDYGTPPDSFAIGYQSLPVLLDACAASCGQMIVRTLEGDVLALNAASSETRLESNVAAWGRLAGGSVADQLVDRTSVVPSSVAVCFGRLDAPGEPYAKENTLASLAIATYSGVTAFSGKKILYHPTRADYTGGGGTPANQAALDLIAARMATDWYGFRFGRFEARLEGAAAWQMEGHTDRVYFDHSRDAIATCGVTTRLAIPPWLEPTSDCGEDPSEGRFIEGGEITWVDVTVNWTNVVIDVDNLVINVVNNDLIINLVDNDFIINGPNYFIVEAPLEVCGWMFWCFCDYTSASATIHNWALPATAPDGEKVVFRFDPTGSGTTLTGMEFANASQVILLVNVNTTGDLTLAHENAGSTAANRYKLEDDEDVIIGPNGMRLCWYDFTSARWRVHGPPRFNLVVGEVDGSPLYSSIEAILFDQADGFVVSNPSPGVARIDFSGGGGGTPGSDNDLDYLGGPFSLTSSYQNVLSVNLAAAGTYHVIATGAADLIGGMGIPVNLLVQLYNSTAVAGAEHLQLASGGDTDPKVGAVTTHSLITVVGATTVDFQARMDVGGGAGNINSASLTAHRIA